MTVKELYEKLDKRIPESLSEPWDNDGLMCSPDTSQEVKKALLTLDVTEEIVDYAIERSYDLIISHHPLIFRPVSHISEDNHVARKLIKLINNGISVFSFHTRLDKVDGGVNDTLASRIGLSELQKFGEGELGRVGVLPRDLELDEFLDGVKTSLRCDSLKFANGYNVVRKVALVGGDGKDFVLDAIKTGADTYISGRISYNLMEEAAELGINLIEAGHYATEFPVTGFFAYLVGRMDPSIDIEIVGSNMSRFI